MATSGWIWFRLKIGELQDTDPADDDDEAVSAEKACDVVDRGDLKDPADARIPPGSTTQPFEEVISLRSYHCRWLL